MKEYFDRHTPSAIEDACLFCRDFWDKDPDYEATHVSNIPTKYTTDAANILAYLYPEEYILWRTKRRLGVKTDG